MVTKQNGTLENDMLHLNNVAKPPVEINRLGDFRKHLTALIRRVARGLMIAGTVGTLALSAVPPVQAADPAGSEFQVNSYTTSDQGNAAVAMDSDGDFVVVWDSSYQDGSVRSIFAQRYNADGVTQGSEFQINSHTTNQQRLPDVAMDSDGDFVVVWESYDDGVQDGNFAGIYAQRYNADGVAQGDEFRVNSYTTDIQCAPSVAIDSDGDFVIAWESGYQDGDNWGIYAQRYNASGVAQGGDFRVNSYTTSVQQDLSVAMDSDGDFVVAWESNGQDGSLYGIYAQRYNASGVAQGSEFPVNSYTTGYQQSPDIAMDSEGDFVVAWESNGQDSSMEGIYAQRYNASGVAQGGEFQVNTYTTDIQKATSVAMDSDGDFVVAWTDESSKSDGQDGSLSGIYAQQYDASGVAQGGEFQVNTYTTNNQAYQDIAADGNGDFVIAWADHYSDAKSNGQDGSGSGVYAQRFGSIMAEQTNGVDQNTSGQIPFNTQQTAVDMYFDSNDVQAGCDIEVLRHNNAPIDAASIPKTNVSSYRWMINHDCNIQSNIEVCFDLDDIPGHGAPTPATVAIYKRDNEGSGPFASAGAVTYNGHGDNELCVQINSFSEFAFGSDDDPLPIGLATFYGEVVKEGIQLHWKTSAENNNRGFYIYRDGIRISDLIEGQGTTTEAHEYTFLDRNVKPNEIYRYMISDIEEGTNNEEFHAEIAIVADVNILGNSTAVPQIYALHDAYPNPFNPKTTIRFDVAKRTNVNLSIYDANGNLVRTLVDGIREADFHEVVWSGTDGSGQEVNSGLYIYRLDTDDFSESKQMILLK